jgi:threonine/homoserine/homoserine lactone efflux protein
MLLSLGLLEIKNEIIIRNTISIVGGIVLIIFGLYQIISVVHKNEFVKKEVVSTHRLFITGVLFTGLNPYFIIWWLTVGSKLILIALEFAALAGVVFMFICHVWMDCVGLVGVSYFAKKGVNALGSKWYRVLLGLFSIILIYFGITFIGDALI